MDLHGLSVKEFSAVGGKGEVALCTPFSGRLICPHTPYSESARGSRTDSASMRSWT
jgi:hypothetical protein